MVQRISQVIAEQDQASAAVLASAQNALDHGAEMRRATEEQSVSSRFIAASIATITERVRAIESSANEHRTASDSVAAAMGRIFEMATGGAVDTGEMIARIETVRAELDALLQTAAAADQSEASASSATDSPA